MKTKFLLVRNVRLAFGLAIVTLLIVGAVSYRGMALSNESDRWVRHTHEVLENLQELVVALKGVESSTRGFVLTGKEAYLKSSRAGVVRAKQVGPVIRALTVDNPTQQRQLPVLESLVAEQMQLGESVIVLRQTQGQAAAADSIQTEAAQRSMSEFERVVREMQNEEMDC